MEEPQGEALRWVGEKLFLTLRAWGSGREKEEWTHYVSIPDGDTGGPASCLLACGRCEPWAAPHVTLPASP